MRKISQRELRNRTAAVMDAVERGETLRVTRRGVEVAEIGPVRENVFVPVEAVLARFRGQPVVDLKRLRAEEDELFGPDALA